MRCYKAGIGIADLRALEREQRSCCAICGVLESDIPEKRKRLHIDHDHVTKRVRGLLCRACNQMLGACRDKKEVLLLGYKYLESAETRGTLPG